MIKILVDAAILNYMNRFTDKPNGNHPGRPALRSVHFAANGDVVATDGHRLGKLVKGYALANGSDPVPECGVGVEYCADKAASSVIKKMAGTLTITIDKGAAFATVQDTRGALVRVSVRDETYPDYARVIPEETDALPSANNVAFNPKYMADFAGFVENDRLQIKISSPISPMIVKNNSLPYFIGVLMPIRWDQ